MSKEYYIYSYYVPVLIKIGREEGYPVKVGHSSGSGPLGKRLGSAKNEWARNGIEVKVPSPKLIETLLDGADEDEDATDNEIEARDLSIKEDAQNLILIIQADRDHEHCVRDQVGGKLLPKSVIKRVAPSTEHSSSVAPTEFTFVSKQRIQALRSAYLDGSLSQELIPVTHKGKKVGEYLRIEID